VASRPFFGGALVISVCNLWLEITFPFAKLSPYFCAFLFLLKHDLIIANISKKVNNILVHFYVFFTMHR